MVQTQRLLAICIALAIALGLAQAIMNSPDTFSETPFTGPRDEFGNSSFAKFNNEVSNQTSSGTSTGITEFSIWTSGKWLTSAVVAMMWGFTAPVQLLAFTEYEDGLQQLIALMMGLFQVILYVMIILEIYFITWNKKAP